MMRALVTGATGFLGSHVANRLAEDGHDVRVLARENSDLSRVAHVDKQLSIGDVTDARAVLNAAHGTDAIFHCAAMYEMGPENPSGMEEVNVAGVSHVVDAARESGATLVHVSSVTAYGPTGTVVRDETHWSDDPPRTHYERTKREGHLIARRGASAGVDVRIVAPGGIYGPDDTSTLGQMIKRYMTTPSPLGWRPEGMQSVVHVDDVADLLMLVADKSEPGEEYLACAQAVTFETWFAEVTAAAGRRPPFIQVGDGVLGLASRLANLTEPVLGRWGPMFSEYLATMGCDFAYSGDKARRDLGWSPRELREGMEQYAVAVGARDS